MADLSYVRGTTYSMTFNYTPPEGAANGATALFSVKTELDNDITDTTNEIMAPKNVAMTDNSCVITIDPSDVSMSHDPARNYVWDIKVLDSEGNIYPAVSGKFKLDVTATNRITA
ncbi:MAG: hypothetical protein V4563_18245 [Pseudomonadota bacterium]